MTAFLIVSLFYSIICNAFLQFPFFFLVCSAFSWGEILNIHVIFYLVFFGCFFLILHNFYVFLCSFLLYLPVICCMNYLVLTFPPWIKFVFQNFLLLLILKQYCCYIICSIHQGHDWFQFYWAIINFSQADCMKSKPEESWEKLMPPSIPPVHPAVNYWIKTWIFCDSPFQDIIMVNC